MNKLGKYKSLEIIEEIKDHMKEQCSSIKTGDWAANLINGEYDDEYLSDSKIILDNLDLPNVPKSLSRDFQKDMDFAIALYENLNISILDANDGRMWTYLSLGKYREYIWSRYIHDISKGTSSPQLATMIGYFFFTGSSANALASNSISKLWWAVHKTIDESLSDPYYYTKVLFSNSMIFMDVMERAAIITNKLLTRAYLEVIAKEKSITKVSKALSPMVLNHLSNHSVYALNQNEMKDLLEEFLNFLRSQNKI